MMLVFFVVGGTLLCFVNEKKAIAAARARDDRKATN